MASCDHIQWHLQASRQVVAKAVLLHSAGPIQSRDRVHQRKRRVTAEVLAGE